MRPPAYTIPAKLDEDWTHTGSGGPPRLFPQLKPLAPTGVPDATTCELDYPTGVRPPAHTIPAKLEEDWTHAGSGGPTLRRQIRERRQYVYAKSQEAQERQTFERKQQMKDALASGKSLPTELKKDAKNLGKDLAFDEAQAEPTTHIDNEYSRAGIQDPKIVITTSRDPSSKLLQFTKLGNQEMRLVFPNSHRINRGNYVVKELADACRANDVTDLIVLHEHRGVPDAMIVSHFPHGPTVYFTLSNVSLRHDIGTYKNSTVSEQYPHLIFENFTSSLGERVRDVLKYLFPVPKEDSKRVMTFANEDDFISFRHHVFVKIPRQVQLAEVGPRFEMKPYEIRQGTIEQKEAEREWVLAHYARTTKKRSILGGPASSAEPPTKKSRR
ncbi:hypothetical protein DXG03_009171 [Asterophora parasitica]|uniref:U3 small nucleolar ribonucleoprotein protein IMP4 n=1 Tax=Asterophora parasitica TaxID=117018 RepID=A0A9P7KA12_9AGAR|nr:hypothetical protein DXG03_009171 [Asterophora parasitica]